MCKCTAQCKYLGSPIQSMIFCVNESKLETQNDMALFTLTMAASTHQSESPTETKQNQSRNSLARQFSLISSERNHLLLFDLVCNLVCHSKLFWLDAIPKITRLNVNRVLSQRFPIPKPNVWRVFCHIWQCYPVNLSKKSWINSKYLHYSLARLDRRREIKANIIETSSHSIRNWEQLTHGVWTFKLNYYTMTTITNYMRSRRAFFIEC